MYQKILLTIYFLYFFLNSVGLIPVEFLNTFVKTNMINGNILNYNRDEVSVDLLIKYFYKCYNTRLKTVSQKPTGKPM